MSARFSFLPKEFKVDYCLASEKAETNLLTYLLWECITPGWTAIFLILSAFWYFAKGREARKNGDHSKQRAYGDAANAFLLWGILNSFVYLFLVIQQRRRKKNL